MDALARLQDPGPAIANPSLQCRAGLGTLNSQGRVPQSWVFNAGETNPMNLWYKPSHWGHF